MVTAGSKLKNKLVSICILHFNRFYELINTINKIKDSTYSNFELIVVDNNSDYFDSEKLIELHNSITIKRLPQNIGIAAWNEAFRIASGDIILVLDDDSFPEATAVELAVSYFEKKPKASIIAANIFNTRLNDYETKNFNSKPDFFVGCGAFIKRDIFKKIGYFNELIFIYHHELDYCSRCYNEGIDIVFLKNIIIFHNQSKIRNTWKNTDPYISSYRFYHYFISYSIILFQRFSFRYILIYFPKWILNRIIVAFRYRYFKEFFMALNFLGKNFSIILKNRNVLKEGIQKFYRYGNTPFFDHDFFGNK